MDDLSQTLHALSDPTRRAILSALLNSDASVTELSRPFDLTPQAISKHIGVLERAGLVSRRREAQRNVSHLESTRLLEVDGWLAAYRQLWEQRFDNLGQAIAQIKAGGLDDPQT